MCVNKPTNGELHAKCLRVLCVHTRLCGLHDMCGYPQIREGERVALSAIGPDSVKILLKAYILARKYVTDDGLDLTRTCATACYKHGVAACVQPLACFSC